MKQREIKFRLRSASNKIVGYEKWYIGERDEETGSYRAIPQWLYSKDYKYWNPQEIFHRHKDQFTGLLDKNGKEIWEGDIVLYPDTYIESVDVGVGMMPVAQTQENSFFPVEFKNGIFGLEIKKSELLSDGFYSIEEIARETSNVDLGDTLEVIGNIYENSGLLKVENKEE